jgi:HK97 family phage major capsid protein
MSDLDVDIKKHVTTELEAQKKTFADLKQMVDKHQDMLAKGLEVPADFKEQIEKAVTDHGLKIDTVKNKVDQVVADMKAAQMHIEPKRKSRADTFLEKSGYKDMKDPYDIREKRIEVDSFVTKDYTDPVRSDLSGSVGQAVDLTRDPNIYHEPMRVVGIRDIIPSIPISGGSLEVVRETFFGDVSSGNNPFGGADYQANQGAKKPQSVLKLEKITATGKTIATYIPITRQALRDVSGIRNYINMRLPYSLAVKMNKELLNGPGTSGELEGINTVATAVSNVAGQNILDAVANGLQLLNERDYAGADYCILNSKDFWKFQTVKDKEGRYLFGDPRSLAGPRIWGVPIMVQNDQPEGNYLVGAFAMGSQLRPVIGSASIRFSENVNDDFIRNQLVILAEEEVILVNQLTSAYAKGTFVIPSS